MSKIQWTDESWNPVVGCSRISPGCKNCYAATAAQSARLQQFEQYQNVKNWDGEVAFVESQLHKPLKWRSPKRIFVCSMSDLFHENVPDEWRDRVSAVIEKCPQHTFQILTKRPENALKYFQNKTFKETCEATPDFNLRWKFLPNVWMGVTVENQQMADKRIPLLLQIPAAVRWLSVEPLLEDIDFLDTSVVFVEQAMHSKNPQSWEWDFIREQGAWEDFDILSALNWVVVGGESGRNARPCAIDWLTSIVQQCKNANTPVFVKQLGSNCCTLPGLAYGYKDRQGGNIEEFPQELQVREFPS